MKMSAGYAALRSPGLVSSSEPANTERYAARDDNPVHRASEQPVSTFSIDVDTGSYSNVRRMLRDGVRPPADAVRAEEFINYFDYHHPAPTNRDTPFRVTTELAAAPWNGKRQILMVGIKGYDVPKATLPPANLVFLLDTSGSMDSPDKLPLLKQAFSMLVPQLRAQDRVSIVVYAGSAGLVLPPTAGDRHDEILASLEQIPESTPAARIDAILDWVTVRHRLANFEGVAEQLATAVELARQSGDKERLARSLSWTGTLHFVTGFPSRASRPPRLR
jgi:hypothetical protein